MLPGNLKEFIYLDAEGIESLYGQTVEYIETSREVTTNKTVAAKVGVAANLKSLFLGFLGRAQVDASAEATGTLGSSVVSSSTPEIHAKLKSLINSLENVEIGVCFSSLPVAAKYSLENKQRVFFCGEYEFFDAPQFHTNTGPQLVSDSGYLIIRCDQTGYIETDDYYKRPKFKAEMAYSVLKMPRSREGMAYTGHDAMFLRGHKKGRLPLGVFSSVIPLQESIQLKPYAIWI